MTTTAPATAMAAIVTLCLAAMPALAAGDSPPPQPLPSLAPAAGEQPSPNPTVAVPMPLTAAPLPHLAPTIANPGSPPAANDPLLARLAGDWIGRGLVRQTPQGDAERVYCKITNVLSADGAELTQKGRCALPNQSSAVHGLITALGGGQYDGSLDTLGTEGPAALTGTGAGDRLVLVAQFIDRLTHQPVTSITTIEVLPAGGYQLTGERTDPKTGLPFTSSKIVFAAK